MREKEIKLIKPPTTNRGVVKFAVFINQALSSVAKEVRKTRVWGPGSVLNQASRNLVLKSPTCVSLNKLCLQNLQPISSENLPNDYASFWECGSGLKSSAIFQALWNC